MIRVKFVGKGQTLADAPVWRRQLPTVAADQPSVWGQCSFTFDPDARDYDWLVVYDDLPPQGSERFSTRTEQLACPPEHTIFVTAEPSSIKTYGSAFLEQFGIIISSLEPWATPAARTLHSQPGLRWYYGAPYSYKDNPAGLRSYDQLKAAQPEKTLNFSTVCSNKRMKHTLHNKRVDFTDFIKSKIPELEIFGHGVRRIDDKAEAIDAYRYHLAIENHICPHHITDKLSDPLLGWALPFYIGAPNAADYIPADSFIALDIYKPDEAVGIIRTAIANNEYEKRLPAIAKARTLFLDELNIFALLERTMTTRKPTPVRNGGKLVARRAMTTSSPLKALRFGLDCAWSKLHRL